MRFYSGLSVLKRVLNRVGENGRPCLKYSVLVLCFARTLLTCE